MLFQVLDADYIFTDNKPIVRIFCKTETGNSACLFYDKFYPYFYIKLKRDLDELNQIKEIKKIEVVKRFVPFGFNENQSDLVKVTVFNPQEVPLIRDKLLKEGIAEETFESDILFKYRFLIDFGIKGMGWIDADVEKVATKTVKCTSYNVKKFNGPINKTDTNLKILSLDIECLPTDPKKPLDPKNNTIIMISLVFSPEYKNKSNLVLLSKNYNGKDTKGFSS